MSNDNIEILGASENNLKHINVTIPKGKLVVFAGVSGSGKSSLAFDTVAVESEKEWQQSYPLFLRNKMPHYDRPKVDEIKNLTPAIVVDQHSLGSNSRSTVGTAVDVAPLLRLLFSRVGKPSAGDQWSILLIILLGCVRTVQVSVNSLNLSKRVCSIRKNHLLKEQFSLVSFLQAGKHICIRIILYLIQIRNLRTSQMKNGISLKMGQKNRLRWVSAQIIPDALIWWTMRELFRAFIVSICKEIMRVAMSHALTKKTFQMDACIQAGMSFFCKHTANAATTRNKQSGSESAGMAEWTWGRG